ncbi:MAG TPA: histidinol-phosphatase, partial [Bacillota bacterium]|nr:histidinol-phosphatase [Bacillota bacterium]
HMYLCRHATGTIDDYVKEAIKLGFDSIGFSDHAPWDELIDRSVRMYASDYKTYLHQLKNAIKTYKGQIKIYKGLEIEYFNGKNERYVELLKDLDYLTLGQHYIEMNGKLVSVYRISSIEELTIYKNTLIKAIKTGYFKFISHPDLFLFSTKEVTQEILDLSEEIIIAAKENHVPLEVNANGIRKGRISIHDRILYRYPREEFWKLVQKHDVPVIISSDAHKPELLFDEAIINAENFSRRLGLRVVEALDFE